MKNRATRLTAGCKCYKLAFNIQKLRLKIKLYIKMKGALHDRESF